MGQVTTCPFGCCFHLRYERRTALSSYGSDKPIQCLSRFDDAESLIALVLCPERMVALRAARVICPGSHAQEHLPSYICLLPGSL